MQDILLDILIIGLLVVLFGSIYRGHATVRLRFWLLGWFFVLLHFGLLLMNPGDPVAQRAVMAAAESALSLCGASFLLSSGLVWDSGWKFIGPALLLSAPPVAFIISALVWSAPSGVLVALGLLTQAAYGWVALHFGSCLRDPQSRARSVVARRWSGSILGVSAVWIVWEVMHGHAQYAIYALFTEVFLTNAILYWEDFRRVSAGVVASVLGLTAWAAVFPSAMALQILLPHLTVNAELWNVPKYFVAFGMILTLLEEQKHDSDRRSEEYRVLFENNPHPMWIYDVQTLHLLNVNDAAVQRYGYSAEEFRRMTLRDIRPADEVEAEAGAMEQNSGKSADHSSVMISGPWTHILRDGRRIQVEVSEHSIHFEGRQARFSLVQDVTERQQLHHRLLHQAHHDMLTGLPNRLLLLDRMEQSLASAARRGRKAAFICVDLDRFKQINDTYGHAVGDLCLRHVAERLRSRLRSADTVARSGGEEFTIVVGDLTSAADAEQIAEDLVSAVRKPLIADQYPIDMTASFGIAIYPDHGTVASELWKSADAAMYRVKRSGGNHYVLVSHEISTSTSEATDLEMYIRKALKEGGFEMHYQPEYRADGTLRALEALVRLHHPRYGMVSPERFIPVAEESGLVVPVGNWVLREVCRQYQEWRRQGIEIPVVAVNVSPLQFMRMDFSRQVRQVLAELDLPPDRLEIEMTETTVMRNLEDVARQMRDLAELGVQFAVDDFGTGYSSLRHLQQLPIQALKIDRSFVERLCQPNGTSALVQATLSLAHSLNLQVVAEGVERFDQMNALIRMRCDVMQGFLFSRPLPAHQIPALVRRGKASAFCREATIAV